MPDPTVFVLHTEVDETDGQGHASNVAFVQWMQDAAVAHSSSVGLTPEAYREMGTAFVVRRHEIQYLRPAPLGARVAIHTWVVDFRGASSRRCYRMVNADTGDELARASTDWAYIDVVRGRPTRIPADVQARFGPLGGPFDSV